MSQPLTSCISVPSAPLKPILKALVDHIRKPSAVFRLYSSSVQSLSHVQLFVTPWTAACQASQSITNSQSSLRLTSIESVMPSNHLILCCPLLFPPSIFPSIRVFSNESVLCIKWTKHRSFSFSISPFNEYSRLIYIYIYISPSICLKKLMFIALLPSTVLL